MIDPTTGAPPFFRKSAFGFYTIGMSALTDGSSNTVFLAEVLQGETYDIRGLMWSTIPGGCSFFSRMPPNNPLDYYQTGICRRLPEQRVLLRLGTGAEPALHGHGQRQRSDARTPGRGAAIRGGSTSCWAMARSGSSRTPSTCRCGWASTRSAAARSSAPMPGNESARDEQPLSTTSRRPGWRATP